GYADRTTCIQQIEQVGRLDAVIIGWEGQPAGQQPLAFRLEGWKGGGQHADVRFLKVVFRPLDFRLVMNVSIGDRIRPGQVVYTVHLLEVHRDPLCAVSNLDRDRVEFDPPNLLEVGKLGDLHPVQADLPSKTPG